MSLRSILTFRDYNLRANSGALIKGDSIRLQMRSPIRGEIVLRETGTDVLTFDEVLIAQVYKSVLPHLDRCEYVVDLGANIGLTSFYFADRFPECRLVAVEPCAKTYEVLCANLSTLVKAGRCKILRAAIWGSEAVLVGEELENPEHARLPLVRRWEPPFPAIE